jgi:hypothetical protein
MGVLGSIAGFAFGGVFQMAITFIGMALVIYYVTKILPGEIAKALCNVGTLGLADCDGLTAVGRSKDVVTDIGEGAGIEGGGSFERSREYDVWEELPALETIKEWGEFVKTPVSYIAEEIFGEEVNMSMVCRVTWSILYDAINKPELVDTPEKLQWLAHLGEYWMGEGNPWGCSTHAKIRGNNSLCGLIRQSLKNNETRLGSRATGLSPEEMARNGTTEGLELLNVMFCGGKFYSRLCQPCHPGVTSWPDNMACRAPAGDDEKDCADTQASSLTLTTYSGDPDGDYSTTEVTIDGSLRVLPKYDCGSGLGIGVGAKRCGPGRYCKTAAGGATVGRCAELPDSYKNCTDGCPADLGPGWDCIDGTCTQNCGPLGLPGTDKSKCLCRPATKAELDANGGVNPYGSGPGYTCTALSVVDKDHPDYEALSALYGTDIPAFGRAIVTREQQQISNQLFRCSDDSVYIILHGVKYHVPDSCLGPRLSATVRAADSPGVLHTWTSFTDRYYMGKPIPGRTAVRVEMEWRDVIAKVEATPFPDGTPGGDESGRDSWPISKVYPRWCELAKEDALPDGPLVPYKTYSDEDISSLIAAAKERQAWTPKFLTLGVDDPNSWGCPKGQVVQGITLNTDGGGTPMYKIKCGDPPEGSLPSTVRGYCNAGPMGSALSGCEDPSTEELRKANTYWKNIGFSSSSYSHSGLWVDKRHILGNPAGGAGEIADVVTVSHPTVLRNNAFPTGPGSSATATCPSGYAVTDARFVENGSERTSAGQVWNVYNLELTCAKPGKDPYYRKPDGSIDTGCSGSCCRPGFVRTGDMKCIPYKG